MEWFPALRIGLANGWVPWVLLVLTEAILVLVSPSGVRRRLFDRSGWVSSQKALTIAGKVLSLPLLALLVLTPLLLRGSAFWLGGLVYLLGLLMLVAAILEFRRTPLGEPVHTGIYRHSRHPQLVALATAFLGMCLMIGSWAALVLLTVSRVLEHWGVLAEEEACLKRYGDAYRAYMHEVPRYLGLR